MRESRSTDLGGGREVTRVPTANSCFTMLHLLTTVVGTERRFAATLHFGRFRSEADIPRASGAG